MTNILKIKNQDCVIPANIEEALLNKLKSLFAFKIFASVKV